MNGTTTGADGSGVYFANGGRVASTGSGVGADAIEIVGTAPTSYCIDLLSAANAVSTVDGTVTLTGTAAAGTDIGIRFGNGIQSTGTGDVTLIGNSMETVSSIAANANTVTLQIRTAGTQINLGNGDSTGVLRLDSTELNRVTAETLIIGHAASGNITVSNHITHPATTDVQLISCGTSAGARRSV